MEIVPVYKTPYETTEYYDVTVNVDKTGSYCDDVSVTSYYASGYDDYKTSVEAWTNVTITVTAVTRYFEYSIQFNGMTIINVSADGLACVYAIYIGGTSISIDGGSVSFEIQDDTDISIELKCGPANVYVG